MSASAPAEEHDHGGHGPRAHGGHRHGHQGGHGHEHTAAPARVLALALALTCSFMVVEAVVGLTSGSLALLADAGHMLSDTGALVLALVAQRFASRPRTARSTFGWRRAEVLAAFVNGVALAVTAVWVIVEAFERWLAPTEIHGEALLLTACVGLGVNALVAALLMRGQRDNLNVRAAFLHVLTDALGSVGAILAGVAVVTLGWTRADPALSVLIAILVALSGWRVLRETTTILLEAAPSHLDVGAIERTILDSGGVASLHDLHVWRISDAFDALTVHVVLERGAHGIEVCRDVAERLRREHHLEHVTVQPEAPPPDPLVSVRRGRDGAPIS